MFIVAIKSVSLGLSFTAYNKGRDHRAALLWCIVCNYTYFYTCILNSYIITMKPKMTTEWSYSLK